MVSQSRTTVIRSKLQVNTCPTLDGYFNPLVVCYKQKITITSKQGFFGGLSKIDHEKLFVFTHQL